MVKIRVQVLEVPQMELVHQRYMTSGDPDTMMTAKDEAQMLIRHIGEAYTGTVQQCGS